MRKIISFRISAKSCRAIKQGKAVLSSGGVRDNNGKIMELAKTVMSVGKIVLGAGKGILSVATAGVRMVTSLLGGGMLGVTSGIIMVSSLASNVQCAFIQKGVNQANIKLDKILARMGKLCDSLGCVQTLSWVTSAFSLANCGISIVGFYKTFEKLEIISGQLGTFYTRYCSDRQDDDVSAFRTLMGRLKIDMEILGNTNSESTFGKDYFCRNEQQIRRDISDAVPFFSRILDEFRKDKIDGAVALQILFTLAGTLLEIANVLNIQYYYSYNKESSAIEECRKEILNLKADESRECIENYIAFAPEYANLSPVRKSAAVYLAYDGIYQHEEHIETCHKQMMLMPENEFMKIDDKLNHEMYMLMDDRIHANGCEHFDIIAGQQVSEYGLPDEYPDDELVEIPVVQFITMMAAGIRMRTSFMVFSCHYLISHFVSISSEVVTGKDIQFSKKARDKRLTKKFN